MAIKIIESGPDLYLTQSEYNRLMAEYHKAFSFYAGTPPTFEDWVRRGQRAALDHVEYVVKGLQVTSTGDAT